MGASNAEERILNEAIDLFYKHGYVKASIRDIVRAVGMSNSSVYNYFRTKDDVLFKIILDAGNDVLGELKKAIENQTDPVERLREMIFRQVHFSLGEYKRMKIYLEEQYQLPPDLRKKAGKQHREVYDLYHARICELEERRLLHAVDKAVATFSIFAMMNWIYRWFNPKGKLSAEEVASQTTEILFRGILKEAPTKGRH
jgi:AcrR family transcriptional regulator